MLDSVVTQTRFGEMVGVSQQAVSEMMARGVLQAGQPSGVWLLAYCAHIREQAAGRDPDGELAAARTRVSNEQADRLAMANAITRREFLPVALIEDVLSRVARQMGAIFDSLVPELRKDCPALVGEPLRIVEAKVARVRELASSICLDTPDPQVDDDAALEADAELEADATVDGGVVMGAD